MQDQLPLIQHGLMWLWRNKVDRPTDLAEAAATYQFAEARTPFRYEDGPAWRLGLEDYQGGSLATLLSDHADQVMAEAAPDQPRTKIVEHLFRALTDINAEGNAVRRPQTLARLVAVTGSDEETLRDIIDHFRADCVCFLTPYGDAPIVRDTLIDISHEALIRSWWKIADEKDGWLHSEFEDGLIWKSLRLQAAKGETLSATATTSREQWLNTLPSPVWTERYDGSWENVQQLMSRSRTARDAEAQRQREYLDAQEQIAKEQAERAAAERQRAVEADAGRRRSRRFAIIASAFGVLALAAAVVAGWNWYEASRIQAEAWLGDSLHRAEQARNQLKEGLPVTAMHLALAGLPETPSDPSARPWLGEAAGALVEALGHQRELQVFDRHQGIVSAVAFSPHGAIVSGSTDGTVRVWDPAHQDELLLLRGVGRYVWSVAYSSDGERIVGGSVDRRIRVWDAGSGQELLVLDGHDGDVWSVAFSPNGAQIVSGSADHTVRVWDAVGGKELLVLDGHEGSVWSAAFSPDGARIVSGSADRTVRVWDAASGSELLVIDGHQGAVRSVAFSGDGGRIVSGSAPSREATAGGEPEQQGVVQVWDAASGEGLLVLRGHGGDVWSVAFSADGDRIVSGSSDRTVRVWDAVLGREQDSVAGRELLVLRGHAGDVWSVAFSADGDRIVSGSSDRTVRVWGAAHGTTPPVLLGHDGDVHTVAFSADGGRIVSGSADRTVRLWDTASGKEMRALPAEEPVVAAQFSPDGSQVVSATADGTVQVWTRQAAKSCWFCAGTRSDQYHSRPMASVFWARPRTTL